MSISNKELNKLFRGNYIRNGSIILVKTKKGNFIRLTEHNINKLQAGV